MSDSTGAAERGDLLLDLGRAAEAEKYFRVALVADPANADLLVSLAQSLQQQERYGAARDAARQALTAHPDHLGALVLLSAAMAGLEDFPAALEAVRRGLQIEPGLAQLHAQVGALLMAQDDSAAALGPLERARTLDPQNSGTVALLSAALHNTRQFEEAERTAREALRLDPDNAEAHRILGLLALRRGGGRSAVDAHRTALRLDPADPEYREGLATAMKSRNPLYGLLLRVGNWQEGLSKGARWLVLLAPFLATRVLRPFDDQVWARVLLAAVFAVVLLSWALEPLMNAVLLCSSYGRNLLPRDARLATYAFLGYAALAVGSVVVGIVIGSDDWLVLALGMGLWAASSGQTHLVDASRRKVAVTLQGIGALLAVWAGLFVALGASPRGGVHPGGLFFLAGLAMLWFTALA